MYDGGCLMWDLLFRSLIKISLWHGYEKVACWKGLAGRWARRWYLNSMKEANAYASFSKRDPELRAYYEKALKPGESVFHKAKKD